MLIVIGNYEFEELTSFVIDHNEHFQPIIGMLVGVNENNVEFRTGIFGNTFIPIDVFISKFENGRIVYAGTAEIERQLMIFPGDVIFAEIGLFTFRYEVEHIAIINPLDIMERLQSSISFVKCEFCNSSDFDFELQLIRNGEITIL